jgi:hypothetical protein
VDQLKLAAERLRLGLRGGWRTPRDAVAWADAQIAKLSDPDASLIEISLVAQEYPLTVAALLAAVPGRTEHGVAMRAALADLLDLVTAAPARAAEAAQMLYVAYLQGDLPDGEFGGAPSRLDDAFALVAEGIWQGRDPAADLLDFQREHTGT